MRKGKKLLSLLLAAVLVLSLAACNKGRDNHTNTGADKPQTVTNSASKQHVYAYEDIDFGFNMDDLNVYDMQYKDGRIYALVEDYGNVVGMFLNGETPENTSGPEADTMDPRVSSTLSFAATVDVAVEEENGEETGPFYYILSVKQDGSDLQTVKLELEAGGYKEILDEEGNCVGTQNGYINSASLQEDASALISMGIYYDVYSDPDNYVWRSTMSIKRIDAQGTLLWEADMTPEEEGTYFWVQNMFVDAEDNVVVVSGEQEIVTLDGTGTEKSRVKMDTANIMNVGQVLTTKDGSVYLTSYNEDWSKVSLSTVDIVTGKLGAAVESPVNLNSYSVYPGITTDFLLGNSMGVYTYNIGDAEPGMMMDFINSDLATYNLSQMTLADDNSFIANYYDTIENKSHTAIFTYVDPADIPDKTTVTLGCFYLGSDIKKQVINFNKTNSLYRVMVKSYLDSGNYDTGMTQMNNDIIGGQMPDIMIVDSRQDISSWVNKGLLADIEKLIAADEELSQKEFLTNIWEAFYVNDHLYTLVPDFCISTYVAKKSLVGDRTGITMSEMQQLLDSLGGDIKAFGDTDMLQTSFLYYLMNYCGTDFVDVNTGKCNFDTDEFVAILEYINTLPTDYSDDYWVDYDWEANESQYRENRALLMNVYISRIEDMIYSIHGYMGEEVTYIGFPGVQGNSSVVQPGSSLYAISAQSKVKEGAWEFVRYYLTDAYQSKENSYSLPVLKSAFEEKAQKATKRPYWEDEEGNKTEYDHTYYLNGEEIILEPFSQEEVEEICEFIYSVHKRSYYNEDIINIVTEEAEYYFSGQKSAKEVAGLIQNRVQLFVDENR